MRQKKYELESFQTVNILYQRHFAADSVLLVFSSIRLAIRHTEKYTIIRICI